MKKLGILILILTTYYLLLTTYYTQPASALEPTPTLTSTPSADPLRQSGSEASLKSKLKALQDQIASKASQLKAEISKKLQNKAYVGTIKTKSDTNLTITTLSGAKTVNINDYTQYVGKKVSFKTLQVDDNLAALGDVDDKDVLTAKKIAKLETILPEKKIILGNIVSISGSTLNIQTKDSQNFSVTMDKNTTEFSDLKLNSTVVVVSTVTKNILTGRFIYIVPNSNLNLKPKIATFAAITATPSATLKPKK